MISPSHTADMTDNVTDSWWVLFNESWGWSRFGWKKYAKVGLLVPFSILIIPLFTLVGNWLRLVQSTANGYNETPEVKYNLEITKEGFWGFIALIPAYVMSILVVGIIGVLIGLFIGLILGIIGAPVGYVGDSTFMVISRVLGIIVTFWIMGPVAGVYADERSFKKAYAIPFSERYFLTREYIIGALLYLVFVIGTAIAWIAFALIGFLIVPILIGLGFIVCSYGSYFGFVYYRCTSD